jgi:hypothetical protein
VYGSNDDKEAYTNLKWQDMPGVATPEQVEALAAGLRQPLTDVDNLNFPMVLDPAGPHKGKWKSAFDDIITVHRGGYMTGREVLQYIGTEVFRKMYGDVWVDSCIRQIEAENPALAIITDCRFPNEVLGTQRAGGQVIRYTRDIFDGDPDVHESENALNPDVFDFNKFDAVIDNGKMTRQQQNKATFHLLMKWGIISDTEQEVLDSQEKLATT